MHMVEAFLQEVQSFVLKRDIVDELVWKGEENIVYPVRSTVTYIRGIERILRKMTEENDE